MVFTLDPFDLQNTNIKDRAFANKTLSYAE